MKKKVRIYKAPDGKGMFVNKTAKFLNRAQEGGQQDKQAQLADYVYKTLDDAEPFEFESIKESLINELASAQIPIDQAEGMVENIAASLSNETAEADELAGQEETTVDDQAQEELRAQEEAAAAAEEERQAGLAQDYGYYDDTAAQGEDEEDEEDYDDEEEAAYMQMGGDLIPEANAVSFTGYDPEQYSQDTQNSFSKGGITKRKYIGSVMKMLKKQDGGEGEKTSQMDPMDTASNEKKKKKDAFIGALASSAQEAKMKEKAEAMWEQEQQAMMQQQVPQYPMQAPMEQVPMAQRGMSVRQMRRLMPRGFGKGQMRSFAGMVPQGGMFPMGMNIMTYPQMQMPEQKPIHVQGTPQGMKLDVRKSNWLTGRPSQYSIEFGGDSAIPGFNMMPGMGYGAKSKQRKTIEGVSKLVNKIADPVNDINKDKGKYDTDGNSVPDNIQSNAISTTSNLSEELDKNRNGILDTTEVATNLPAVTTATNPNKDAGGKGSNPPTKSATAKTNTATPSKNAGQTKIPKSAGSSTEVGKNTVLKAPITNKGVLKSTPVAKTVVKKVQPKSLPVDNSSWTDNFATSWDEVGQNALNFGDRLKKGWDANVDMASDLGERVKKGWNSNWGAWTGLQFEQDGGFIDSTNPDLYKFVYGGNEQFPDPITQQDADYANSKNTGSPYFANGGYVKYQMKGEVKDWDKDGNGVPDSAQLPGLKAEETKKEEIKKEEPKKSEFQAITSKEDYDKRLAEERKKWQEDNAPEDQEEYSQNGYRGYTGYPQNAFNRYFPANTIRKLGTYSQQMGMPYGADGSAYTGGFGPNTNLSKIDVRKSGWLSGKPKKYTMYFNNPEMDPTKPQFAINDGSAASGSGDGSANKEVPNSDGIYPSTGTSFPPEESTTRKMRRENRRYDKHIRPFLDPNKEPNFSNEEEEDVTEGGPSAEEIAARDAATLANKDVVREFSDVEGEQNDPFGIGSPTAEDLARQDEMDRAPQDLSALRNANASGTQDYNQNQEMMNQLDEASFNAQQDQLSRQGQSGSMTQEQAANLLMNNPFSPGYSANQQGQQNLDQEPMDGEEEQFSGGQNMYQNSVPGFGGDMSGVPMMNGSISPWSLPDGFNPNTGMEQGDGSGSAPYAENLPFLNQGDGSDTFGYGVKSKQQIQKEQKLQQQRQAKQNATIANKKGQSQSGSQGSNANAAANDSKSEYYDPKTFGAQGIVQRAKKDKDGYASLLDSELGERTLFAIDHQWEKDPAMQKKYGTYENYLKTFGYWDLVQADKKKKEKNDADRKKATKKNTSSNYTPSYIKDLFGFQDGGNLNRFVYGDEVTKTSTGTPSPIVYTNNRALEGLSDVDLTTNNSGLSNLQSSSFFGDQQSFNKPTLDQQTGCTEDQKKDPTSKCYDAEKYGMKIQDDALGSARETTQKTYAPKAGSFGVDFKNKNMYEVDAQGMLNSGNAAAKGVLNFFEKRGQRKQNKNFYDRFTADNLYAGDPIRDRGDYEANSGLYRPDEQGQTWNSRSAKYGGFMQSGGFVEGDIVDMTPEEIQEFLANGGELEMIS